MDRYLLTVGRLARVVALRAPRRTLAVAAVALVAFALVGDRGVRSAAGGTDPLDILDLQAKANAFIVIDTSSSMGQTKSSSGSNFNASDDYITYNLDGTVKGGGKMAVAKRVLLDVIAANQESVAFSLGTYTQGTTSLPTGTNRFVYFTTDTLSPGMATSEIIANSGGSGGTLPFHRGTGDDWVEDGETHYQLFADRFVNGVTYTVQSDGGYCSTTVGTATSPPSVTLIKVNSATDCTAAEISRATFKFAGVPYNQWGGMTGACEGYREQVALAPCDRTDQLVLGGIGNFLRPSLLFNAAGTDILGYVQSAAGGVTTQPTVGGVRAAGYTPIAETLIDLLPIWNSLWSGTISAQEYKQSTFAIVLTDGDDTCPTASGSGFDYTNNALRAAHKAQLLYAANNDGVHAASRFRTFVVAFGDGVTVDRANYIAWGGTGMTRTTTGSGTAARWNTAPTAAEGAACATCVDAFAAANVEELTAALNSAINMGLTEGAFADRATLGAVFEFGADAMDPAERYLHLVPVLVQSSWELPGFLGHLRGYANISGVAAMQWDAGVKLLDRVDASVNGTKTFANLHGGATDSNLAAALIKRRIYTTSGNGNNPFYTGASAAQNLIDRADATWARVTLWPPASDVDPASGSGILDGALGLTSYTYAQLRTLFGACTGTNLPAVCVDNAAGLARAQKEAREIVLAYMAGAQVNRVGIVPQRTTGGELQYTKRTWILADGTTSTPAMANQPAQGNATLHTAEYELYTVGPRAANGQAGNGVLSGLGLTTPDSDNRAASANDVTLKPVMTVIYHAANDMLHAFRAGPCPGGTGCAGETGGEELWGFVPYDQLGNLTKRFLTVQTRENHTYMMAASPRLSNVFVPGDWSRNFSGVSASGTGVWRLELLVGRGPRAKDDLGGKYLTALDVTVPGPATSASLSTAPPIVMWNRGNGDGITSDAGYGNLGETWSVPAVGPVDPNVWGGVEFVAFVGSGYSDVASEGKMLYAINALTGVPIYGWDVGSGTATYSNAIVASPSLFQPNVLAYSTSGVPLFATDPGTLLFFPDAHGRIWRYDLATPAAAPTEFEDLTADQPIGVGMALLNVDSGGLKPHVFATSGADTRVTADHAFLMAGFRDEAGTATSLFSLAYPERYRGTLQPAVSYDIRGAGIALFDGTRFNPATTQCISSFDSILYIVETENGDAAYDLPEEGGRAIGRPGTKDVDLGVSGGSPRTTGGLHPDVPTAPPSQMGMDIPEPVVSVGPPRDPTNGNQLAEWPGTIAFRLGTGFCR